MRYYVDFSAEKKPLGFMEYPYENQLMTEVTREEYFRLRKECGFIDLPPQKTPDEERDLLLAQLLENQLLMLNGMNDLVKF